jgi:hypothetical protein
MEKFFIEPTKTNPLILFDKQNNTFRIEGKSVLENGHEIFEPALSWLESYCQSPNICTHIEFNLEYFNISSSKNILSILYKLNDLKKSGHEVKATWYYDEDEMYEFGEDFAFLVEIPFNFQEFSTNKKTSVHINNSYKTK